MSGIRFNEIYIAKYSEHIKNFIIESNKIEGIKKFDMDKQFDAYADFLCLDIINVSDILKLARTLNSSCKPPLPTPYLREKKGMDVRVGNYYPAKGGTYVRQMLETLLMNINDTHSQMTCYKFHCEYESIHPLTDCNGRTGRAIWLWMMMGYGWNINLGFLHSFYYQALDAYRD